MAIQAIFFDFDGTVADTYDTFVEIINNLSGEFGYQPVTTDDLERFKNLSAREVIQEAHLSPLKVFCILRRIKAELNPKIQFLKPILGIEAVLQQLKKQGYTLGIITSNRLDNVRRFLEINQLDSLFDFVYSGTPLFGKHKVINKLLKKHKFKPPEIIYIGDETRDIQSAKQSKVKMIAVSWGFNSAEILAKHEPDFLVNHPQELVEVIKKSDCHLQTINR